MRNKMHKVKVGIDVGATGHVTDAQTIFVPHRKRLEELHSNEVIENAKARRHSTVIIGGQLTGWLCARWRNGHVRTEGVR